jgi:uncharacterized protein YdcH (DUF465 family)
MSNLQKFNKTLESLDLEVNRLNAVTDAYKKLEDLIKTYENIISVLKENNVNFIKLKKDHEDLISSIEKSIKSINSSIDEMEVEFSKLIQQKTDLIRKENKEFYHDFEKTVHLKLRDHRSEIKQLIESERSQIKQIIEGESSKVKELIQANSSQYIEILKKETKTLKISVWVLGGILIVLASFLVYKSLI